MRSVHFGSLPFEAPKASRNDGEDTEKPKHPPKREWKATPDTTTAAAPRGPNVLQVYSAALYDTELLREKLRGLVTSNTRHGDLQVALSAVRRIESSLRSLIAEEEN